MSKGYPLAPQSMSNDVEHRRKIAQTANLAIGGKLNATLLVTLAANVATTTVTDERIGATTFFGFQPKTANAAGALSGLYVSSQANGTATLTHSNNAQSDRTFNVLLIG